MLSCDSTTNLVKVSKVMSSQYYGYLEPFIVGNSIDEYVSRMEHFFKLNNVPAEKQVSAFVVMAGPKVFQIAKEMYSPEDLGSKSFAELTTLLKQFLSPPVSVVTRRYRFHQSVQSCNQSITEYAFQLEERSQICQFEKGISSWLECTARLSGRSCSASQS